MISDTIRNVVRVSSSSSVRPSGILNQLTYQIWTYIQITISCGMVNMDRNKIESVGLNYLDAVRLICLSKYFIIYYKKKKLLAN